MFNQNSNLYGREWLATVFANRNQQYGAFKLRKQSSQTLLTALFISAPLFVAMFALPGIIGKLNGSVELITEDPITPLPMTDHVIRDLEKPILKTKQTKAEAALPKAIPLKTKVVAMSSNIKVVKDHFVSLSPPTSAEVDNAVIGSITRDGVTGKVNAAVGTGDLGGGIETGGKGNGGSDIYDAAGVDVFPEFPGGMSAWSKYIQRNLRYPGIAQEEGIQGKVFLSFVVEKDGTITDVKVLSGIGYGCDDEAVRVIKKSPHWKAGMQNNLPVRVKYTMPISYTVSP